LLAALLCLAYTYKTFILDKLLRRETMKDRTAAIIITIVAVVLCGCPGLAAFCLGISSLALQSVDFYTFTTDQNSNTVFGGVSICSGIILVLLTVLVAFLVLRRKKVTPQPPPPEIPDEPIPPTI
jgi:hypothetical protein